MYDSMDNKTYSMPCNITKEGYFSPLDLLHVKIILSLLYTAVLLVCVIGNLLVVFVVLRHRLLRTTTNVFLTNLAVADFLVGVFCILPTFLQFLDPVWKLGKVMCKCQKFIQLLSYTASIITLIIISAERYVAIIHPLACKTLTTPTRLRVVLVLVWLSSAIYSSPQLGIYDLITVKHESYCLITGEINLKAYTTFTFIVLYLLPVAFLFLVYTRICIALWRSMNGAINIRHSQSTPVTKAQVPLIAQNSTIFFSKSSDIIGKEKNASEDSDCSDKCLIKMTPVSMPSSRSAECIADNCSKRGSQNGLFNCRQYRTSDSLHRMIDKSGYLSAQYSAADRTQRRITSFSSYNGRARSMCSIENRKKVIRLLMVVVLSFTVLVLPYHIRVMLEHWSPLGTTGYGHSLFPQLTFVLLYLNSAINPILYAFLSSHFRRCMLDVFRCRKSKETVHSVRFVASDRTWADRDNQQMGSTLVSRH